MSNKRSIIKEQLLSEGRFIEYCNDSNDRRVGQYGKLHMRVKPSFLRALEEDGFLQPLLVVEESARQQDGSTEVMPVRYYSPFQIFIVAELSNNEIEDGRLQSPDVDKEWQKQQKSRFVSWGYGGGMSFNAEHAEYRKGTDANGRVNAYGVCEYLQNFLRLLHSLDLPPRYSEISDRERERGGYINTPKLQYELSAFQTAEGSKLLEAYDLDNKKLEILRANVGHVALAADPLEKWYPFIRRLPQWRRDELKGEALLAQDLYGLCELLADVSEVVTGKRPATLPVALQSDFLSPMDKRNEYASGTDIEAIKLAISKTRAWMSQEAHATLVRDHVGKDAPAKVLTRLKELDGEIEDFKKRYEKYGAGRSVSNWGFMHFGPQDTKSIPLKDLDPKSQKTAVQMFEQRKAHGAIENEEQELQSEIRHAIRWRLDDINRDFTNLIYELIRPLDDQRWRLDREKESHQHTMEWMKEFQATQGPSEDNARSNAKFWREFVPAKKAEFDKKIQPFIDAPRALGGFANLARLVLCANCRKNTVLLHQAQNDKKASPEAICDECIAKGEHQKIKGGEWHCNQCGQVIYKFAHGNVISDVLFNTSSATIQLDYGRITLRARCPNKECRAWNDNEMEWGWLL